MIVHLVLLAVIGGGAHDCYERRRAGDERQRNANTLPDAQTISVGRLGLM